jgi:protein ImuB
MARILSVWLPNWPISRLQRLGIVTPDKAFATLESRHGVRSLVAVCPRAAAQGLRPDQTLAQARAICPALEVIEADPAADVAALAALARWCERCTPLAAPDPPDGLWLDIAGCAQAFGDETGLAQTLAARLERAGIPCHMSIADSSGAAWALARAATPRGGCTIIPAGMPTAQPIALLPVALLRLEARVLAGLRRVGLKTIGELARQPRGEISARFGPQPMRRLDEAMGSATAAISWPRLPCLWSERRVFAEPIGTPEDLRHGLALLAENLCARLEAAQRGGHGFIASFFRVDAACIQISIATALPVRDARYVTKLLSDKLEMVDPGFGIDAMLLEADPTAPLRPPQMALGAMALGDLATETDGKRLVTTIDQLANRLGAGRLWRDAPQASHVPERAVRRIPPLPAGAPAWLTDPMIDRPVRMLRRPEPIDVIALLPDDPPMQFSWRGAAHRVRAASGPERIAAEWWRRTPDDSRRDSDLLRDYYRLEDSAGARFWVFRAGLAGTPRWFLHGLFG